MLSLVRGVLCCTHTSSTAAGAGPNVCLMSNYVVQIKKTTQSLLNFNAALKIIEKLIWQRNLMQFCKGQIHQ